MAWWAGAVKWRADDLRGLFQGRQFCDSICVAVHGSAWKRESSRETLEQRGAEGADWRGTCAGISELLSGLICAACLGLCEGHLGNFSGPLHLL